MQESSIYRSILAEGEAKGEAKGEARKQREIARNLLQAGIAIDIIASTTGLSVEDVQQLQQELNQSSQN